VSILATSNLLDKGHNVTRHASHAALVRGCDSVGDCDNTDKAPNGLLAKIGLSKDTLGGVNIWEIECRSGVTRIENGCEAHTALKRPYHNAVHLVVGNMSNLAEVNRVDNLIISVFLVAIEIFRLTAVALCRC
jgi:hypothetical protein